MVDRKIDFKYIIERDQFQCYFMIQEGNCIINI